MAKAGGVGVGDQTIGTVVRRHEWAEHDPPCAELGATEDVQGRVDQVERDEPLPEPFR